jgi:hypothetical protein
VITSILKRHTAVRQEQERFFIGDGAGKWSRGFKTRKARGANVAALITGFGSTCDDRQDQPRMFLGNWQGYRNGLKTQS